MRIVLFCLIAAFLGLNDIEHQPTQNNSIRLNSVRPITILDYIDTMALRYNIPKEVIFGVGWNESHLGASPLARKSNNLFGIKCGDGWKGERCGKYRAYSSKLESIEDFCKYIHKYYFHLIGKPLNQWYIKGYAAKPYKF